MIPGGGAILVPSTNYPVVIDLVLLAILMLAAGSNDQRLLSDPDILVYDQQAALYDIGSFET